MTTLTIGAGADTELVPVNLIDMGFDNLKLYEANLFRTGTKYKPLVIDEVCIHPDSLGTEFAMPVYHDPVDFLMGYNKAKTLAEQVVGFELEGKDYIDLSTHYRIGADATPQLWENATIFGCSPDWQVLAGRASLREHVPVRVRQSPVKELGGHIHLTLPPWMLPPVLKTDGDKPVYDGAALAPVIDELYDRIRHLHQWDHPTAGPWYRKPKVFRPKPYGLEYRSLGASVMDDARKRETLVNECFQFMDDCFSGRVCI